MLPVGITFANGPGRPVAQLNPKPSRTTPVVMAFRPEQPGSGCPAVTVRVLVQSKISLVYTGRPRASKQGEVPSGPQVVDWAPRMSLKFPVRSAAVGTVAKSVLAE